MPDALATAVTNTNPNSCVNVQCSRIGKPWQLSPDGISFIAVWESGLLNGTFAGHKVTEGFILRAYLDNKGIPTVGCGHRIQPGDNIDVGDIITLERAREFKKKAFREIEARLNKDIHVPLHRFEYDAICSISYNCGAYGGSDDLVRKINTGVYSKMHDYILAYRVGNNGGVANRRRSEANLFSTGIYNASH